MGSSIAIKYLSTLRYHKFTALGLLNLHKLLTYFQLTLSERRVLGFTKRITKLFHFDKRVSKNSIEFFGQENMLICR
jgi:hypothetical protein